MNQLAAMIFAMLFGYTMGTIAAALGADGMLVAGVVATASGIAGGWLVHRRFA
jgi:uncharacterized membrane protein